MRKTGPNKTEAGLEGQQEGHSGMEPASRYCCGDARQSWVAPHPGFHSGQKMSTVTKARETILPFLYMQIRPQGPSLPFATCPDHLSLPVWSGFTWMV